MSNDIEAYTNDLCKNHIHKKIYFEKYFKGCKRILDIGCGRGNFIQFAPDKIEGCDNGLRMLKIAKERRFNVKFVNIRKRLPYPDNTFDAINLKEVIEHLTYPMEVIKECYRILKPKGKLVILTPDVSRLGVEAFYNALGHTSPFTKESVRSILVFNKFKEVNVVRWQPYVFGVNTLFGKGYLPMWIYNLFEKLILERFGKEVVGVGYKRGGTNGLESFVANCGREKKAKE